MNGRNRKEPGRIESPLERLPSRLRYPVPMNASTLAKYIDHTLLKATATTDEIEKLCSEAREHHFKAVCVNPSNVRTAKRALEGSGVLIATVCGFPLGAVTPQQKALEARESLKLGADEIDMVINIGAAKSGDWTCVLEDILAVREATLGATLKVIVETCFLSREEKIAVTEYVLESDAEFIKTSTGFGSGGATLEDVRLMAGIVGGRIGIKAAGGVRNTEDAHAFIEAGATRLGTSGGVAIVQGAVNVSGY